MIVHYELGALPWALKQPCPERLLEVAEKMAVEEAYVLAGHMHMPLNSATVTLTTLRHAAFNLKLHDEGKPTEIGRFLE